VSIPAPEGPLSCRVQLKPQLNTPEAANQSLSRHTRIFQAGVEAGWSKTLQPDSYPQEQYFTVVPLENFLSIIPVCLPQNLDLCPNRPPLIRPSH